LNNNINRNQNKNNTLSSAEQKHQKHQPVREHSNDGGVDGDGDDSSNNNSSSSERILIDFGFYSIPYDSLVGYTLSHVDTLNEFAQREFHFDSSTVREDYNEDDDNNSNNNNNNNNEKSNEKSKSNK